MSEVRVRPAQIWLRSRHTLLEWSRARVAGSTFVLEHEGSLEGGDGSTISHPAFGGAGIGFSCGARATACRFEAIAAPVLPWNKAIRPRSRAQSPRLPHHREAEEYGCPASAVRRCVDRMMLGTGPVLAPLEEA